MGEDGFGGEVAGIGMGVGTGVGLEVMVGMGRGAGMGMGTAVGMGSGWGRGFQPHALGFRGCSIALGWLHPVPNAQLSGFRC